MKYFHFAIHSHSPLYSLFFYCLFVFLFLLFFLRYLRGPVSSAIFFFVLCAAAAAATVFLLYSSLCVFFSLLFFSQLFLAGAHFLPDETNESYSLRSSLKLYMYVYVYVSRCWGRQQFMHADWIPHGLCTCLLRIVYTYSPLAPSSDRSITLIKLHSLC